MTLCDKENGWVFLCVDHPETEFLVLSEHTHDAADVKIADNLRCIVAKAEYGQPDFRIFELPDMFSGMNHDEWFRREVEKVLDATDDLDAVYINNEVVEFLKTLVFCSSKRHNVSTYVQVDTLCLEF